MTLANKITFGRMLLIPALIGCAVCYTNSFGEDGEDIRWRIATIVIYALAMVSDAVDGWVARRFNQRTLLGATIDPIADKLLMLCTIFTLGVLPWTPLMPPWFVVLTFARETVILLGIAFMYGFLRKIEMGPNWVSKVSTVLQMACVAWILIDFRHAAPELPWLLRLTALFMVVSAAIYVREGLRQFAVARNRPPEPASVPAAETHAPESTTSDAGRSDA